MAYCDSTFKNHTRNNYNYSNYNFINNQLHLLQVEFLIVISGLHKSLQAPLSFILEQAN